jgi:hypothetical protein
MSAERRERARQKARRARTNKERARESCGRAAEAHCGLDHRAARAWAETKVLHPHTDSAKQAARRREARSRTPTKNTARHNTTTHAKHERREGRRVAVKRYARRTERWQARGAHRSSRVRGRGRELRCRETRRRSGTDASRRPGGRKRGATEATGRGRLRRPEAVSWPAAERRPAPVSGLEAASGRRRSAQSEGASVARRSLAQDDQWAHARPRVAGRARKAAPSVASQPRRDRSPQGGGCGGGVVGRAGRQPTPWGRRWGRRRAQSGAGLATQTPRVAQAQKRLTHRHQSARGGQARSRESQHPGRPGARAAKASGQRS